MNRWGVQRSGAEIMFGAGAVAALPAVVAQTGRRCLVCTDPIIAALPPVAAALEQLRALDTLVIVDSITPDLPLAVLDDCLAAAQGRRIDVVVGLGGGSAIDAAKLTALLLSHPGPLEQYYGENAVPGPILPVIAVPTTAGTGSEVTPVAVVGDPRRQLKVGISSAHLVPRVAICDPELTLSCPASVTAFSGIDALAHAVEAYTARIRPRDWSTYPGEVFQGPTAFSDRYALEAISVIGPALERAVNDGSDAEARGAMLYGSLCAGLAFGNAGTAGAHVLQYPIGAATGTPHGLGVGLLLPYVLSFIAPVCGPRLARVAEALGVGDTPQAAIGEIARLAEAVGVPRTLADIGLQEDALPGYAQQAATVSRLAGNSPRKLDAGALLAIAKAAYSGDTVTLAT